LFTLQTLMLVALGILLASLVVVAILPAYRRRVERLTTDEIRRSIPLTEAEIRADKDRLRAQYAIRVHKLEAEGEQLKLSVARQRIEMNRRDARITELQDAHEALKAALEENVNARRVLEHTVTDRLPRLEQQLESARVLIGERDQEMASLRSETTRNVRALDEAMQINAQQRGELERLSSALTARGPQARESFGEMRFDGEIALRSEVEALRARTRDQAQLIMRLQAAVGGAAPAADGVAVDAARRELTDPEALMRSAGEAAQSGSFDRAAAESQAKELNARIAEQAAEIARLKAAVATFEGEADAGGGSRLTAKARLSALQVQSAQQAETIQRLRADLAASNERLARQAAHFMDEMRRLGAGTVPATMEPRRTRDAAPRRGLADRIGSLRPVPVNGAGEAAATEPASSTAANGAAAVTDPVSPVEVETVAAEAPAAEPAKRKLRLLERIAGGKA
jgi:uncharacterized coiled-coil protein SlyX